MISEGIDSEYGRNAPLPSDSESQRYINELMQADIAPSNSQASVAAPNRGPWSDKVYVVDSNMLEKFVSGGILSREWESKKALSSWCETDPMHSLAKVISYVLPVSQVATMHESTTACAVSIVYAETFQVVVEYRDEADVLNHWRKWQHLQEQQDSPDVRKKERKRIEQEIKWIEKEVSKALTQVDPKTGDLINADDSQIKEFLSQPQLDMGQVPELRRVLGSRFALCGAGDSAIKDRIFARRVLHYAQGIPDPTHTLQRGDSSEPGAGVAAQEDDNGAPPFLYFGNDAYCLRFGKRTAFALKQLTVMGPCAIAPQRGSGQRGWFDPCGLADGDLLKKQVFARSANHADAVLVVCRAGLEKSAATKAELPGTKAMIDVVEAEAKRESANTEGAGPSLRMFLASNLEKNIIDTTAYPLRLDRLSSESVQRAKQNARRSCLDALKEVAKDIAKSNCQKKEAEAEQIGRAVTDGAVVPVACPTMFLFASLVLNTNYEQLQWQRRLELLEQTDCFPMLGFIERVLQGSKREMVEDLRDSVKKQLTDLRPRSRT